MEGAGGRVGGGGLMGRRGWEGVDRRGSGEGGGTVKGYEIQEMVRCERILEEEEEEGVEEGGASRRLVVLGSLVVEVGGGRVWEKKEGNSAAKGEGRVAVVVVVVEVVEVGGVVEVDGMWVEECVEECEREVGGSCQVSSESLSSSFTVWNRIPLSPSQSCSASPLSSSSSSSPLPSIPASSPLYPASSSEDEGE